MNTSRFSAVALALVLLALPVTSFADTGAVAGKWTVQADTPQGPMELGFDLKLEGGQLVGTVTTLQSVIPMSELKFEDPQLSMQINVMGGDFKLTGVLKEGKLTGTWEQIGGEMKGTWTAQRDAAPSSAPVPTAQPSTGIDGSWNSVAVTPEGDLAFGMELKSSGSTIEGRLIAGGATIPISKASFADGKLSFEIEYDGGLYRIEATLAGDKLSGKWSAVDGTDSGAWSAARSKP